MMRLIMKETDEYERLVKFFVENELEFDGDEEVDTDIVKCYKVTHGEEDKYCPQYQVSCHPEVMKLEIA